MIAIRTPQREFLETALLPRFASRFAPDALVLNIGAGDDHPYREFFPCPLRTSDRTAAAGCDEIFVAEDIPYANETVDGIVFVGVFDRLDDPMRAMREFARVLKRSGTMLFGATGLDFPWHDERDRWRLSPGGMRFIVRDFHILEEEHFDRIYDFYVLSK